MSDARCAAASQGSKRWAQPLALRRRPASAARDLFANDSGKAMVLSVSIAEQVELVELAEPVERPELAELTKPPDVAELLE